jgi:hypothetical protein
LRPLLLLTVLFLAGCPDPPRCPAGFIGDPKLPPEGIMVYTNGYDRVLHDVMPGDAIPLEPPPQGGYVMYVAARVKNMDACGIEFRGRLRDPATGNEVGFDARSATLQKGADGYGRPDPGNNANLSNVNGCPDYTAKDVHLETYDIEVTVVDRQGRRLDLKHPVVPTCMISHPDIQKDCECTCKANYFLGKCRLVIDGGTDDGPAI